MNRPLRFGFVLMLAIAATYLLLGTLAAWVEMIRHFGCGGSERGLLCQIGAVSMYALYVSSIFIVPILIGLFAWLFFYLLSRPPAPGSRPGGVSLGAVLLAYISAIGLAGVALTLLLGAPVGGPVRLASTVLLSGATGAAACGLWRLYPGGRKLALAVLAASILITGAGLLSWAASFAARQWATFLLMLVMEIGLLIYLLRPGVIASFTAAAPVEPIQ
jgi:hypothetical protein